VLGAEGDSRALLGQPRSFFPGRKTPAKASAFDWGCCFFALIFVFGFFSLLFERDFGIESLLPFCSEASDLKVF